MEEEISMAIGECSFPHYVGWMEQCMTDRKYIVLFLGCGNPDNW